LDITKSQYFKEDSRRIWILQRANILRKILELASWQTKGILDILHGKVWNTLKLDIFGMTKISRN
jgi:hypothetical protein